MDVIFDMDMTLCSSRPALRKAIRRYFADFNVELDFEDFAEFMGRSERLYIRHLCGKNQLEYQDGIMERIWDFYEEYAPELVTAYEGGADTVRALKEQGRRVALASSADRRKVLINIQRIGLTEADFDAVVAGDEVAEAKPSPEVFLFAAEKMGADASDCVVVEDSKNGILAGKASGAKVIGFTSVHSREELLSWGADEVVDALPEIAGLMRVM